MKPIRAIALLALLCTSPSWAAFRVGLVLDTNGKKDKGFNAAAFQGLEKAKAALGFEAEAVEAASESDHEAQLRNFAKKRYDLVIALGSSRVDALQKVALAFPKNRFAIIDGVVKAPNVRSILFREDQGSFLAGALAGWVAAGKGMGFVGGMDTPVTQKYIKGFGAGVAYASPSSKVDSRWVGGWANPAKAKELASELYTSGAEVVYAVAGGSNSGVFDAAEGAGKFAIGVANQNAMKPGRVITSMRKRTDIAVFMTCQDAKMGGFKSEVKNYGLAEQGVDLVITDETRKIVSPEILAKVDQLKEDITQGKVPGALK